MAGRCAACRRVPRRITRIRSIGPYDGALRRIVQAFKYGSRSSIGRPLGLLMRARGADVLDGATCVVPVPLHASRRRQRGFNQAELLARALERPILRPLVRRRATPPQASLPAARRFANVRHAFDLRRDVWYRATTWRGLGIHDQVVLLVDDVVTTGATLEACAEILLRAGAAEVRALTAARADRPGLKRP